MVSMNIMCPLPLGVMMLIRQLNTALALSNTIDYAINTHVLVHNNFCCATDWGNQKALQLVSYNLPLRGLKDMMSIYCINTVVSLYHMTSWQKIICH
jgi:hypothetical protein